MSNISFNSVKNIREPFYSLNVSRCVISDITNKVIQVSGNIIPGDKPYKTIQSD